MNKNPSEFEHTQAYTIKLKPKPFKSACKLFMLIEYETVNLSK